MTGSASRGRLRARLLWTAAGVVGALLLVKAFVVDVYRVTSTSMEPTLYGAEGRQERVLVAYDRSPPERWEPVVIRRPGEPDALVKRVVATAGERVQIVGGDCLIDGRPARGGVRRPGPFVLWDARRDDLAPLLARDGEHARWTFADGVLTLDATAGARAATYLVPEVTDGYRDPAGELVRGEEEVNDLVLEAACTLEPGARLALGLTEQGDLFRVEIAAAADGTALRFRLARAEAEAPTAPGAELATAELAYAKGTPSSVAVRFANVDDELAVDVDGERVLTHRYEQNRFDPSDKLFEGRHYRARFLLAADGGPVRIAGLRLARDVYYTARGTHGTREPLPLGPDRVFVLGDNSAHSRDGREWGPVSTAELIGRPRWVVWPPSRWRALDGNGSGGGGDGSGGAD